MGIIYFYVFIRENLCLDILSVIMYNLNFYVNDKIFLEFMDVVLFNCYYWLIKIIYYF